MNRFLPIAFAALLLFAVSSDPVTVAQSPSPSERLTVDVDGPETVQPGKLVKLTAGGNGEAFAWRLAGASADLYDVSESGKACYFATATPGRYVFVVAAARGNPPELLQVEFTITVEGVAPGPQPQPVAPVLPDGRYKLAQFAYDLAKKLPATDKPLLSELGGNYSAVASQAAAGILQTVELIQTTTRTRNAATVKAERERLIPVLFQPLANRLSEMSKAGELSSVADHVTAWQEIAAGLYAGGR